MEKVRPEQSCKHRELFRVSIFPGCKQRLGHKQEALTKKRGAGVKASEVIGVCHMWNTVKSLLTHPCIYLARGC